MKTCLVFGVMEVAPNAATLHVASSQCELYATHKFSTVIIIILLMASGSLGPYFLNNVGLDKY